MFFSMSSFFITSREPVYAISFSVFKRISVRSLEHLSKKKSRSAFEMFFFTAASFFKTRCFSSGRSRYENSHTVPALESAL